MGASNAIAVSNNVIVECTGTALVGQSASIAGSGCNVLWNNDADYFTGWDVTAGDVNADPIFCDPDQGNYTIGQLSPAAVQNAGTCGAIGAHEVGCGATQVDPETWSRIKNKYR